MWGSMARARSFETVKKNKMRLKPLPPSIIFNHYVRILQIVTLQENTSQCRYKPIGKVSNIALYPSKQKLV
jgi:hypothetical protein